MQASVAYDLSRFETKKKPEVKKQPELKAVKSKTKSKKKTQALSFLSPATACIAAVLLVIVCGFMLYTRVMITETTKAITSTNKQIVQLQSESVRLDSELDAIMARGNIEEKALALGMYEADKLQVECIEVNKGDKIEVLSDSRNVFEKVGDFFSNLF